MVDAKPIPSASVQPRQQQMVLYLHHESMLTLEDVSAPVLKLAGARFNPVTLSAHGPNAPNLYHTALELQSLSGERERRPVAGIPPGARMEHFAWSPDGTTVAFSLRTSEVGDDDVGRLWLLDLASATAAPVQPEQPLNCVLGAGCPTNSSGTLSCTTARIASHNAYMTIAQLATLQVPHRGPIQTHTAQPNKGLIGPC